MRDSENKFIRLISKYNSGEKEWDLKEGNMGKEETAKCRVLEPRF